MVCVFFLVTCLVAFDEKFDCFSSEEMKDHSQSSRLMEAALISNSLVLLLDHTKNIKQSHKWKTFRDAMLYMERYISSLF